MAKIRKHSNGRKNGGDEMSIDKNMMTDVSASLFRIHSFAGIIQDINSGCYQSNGEDISNAVLSLAESISSEAKQCLKSMDAI